MENRFIDPPDFQGTVLHSPGHKYHGAGGYEVHFILNPEFNLSSQVIGFIRIPAEKSDYLNRERGVPTLLYFQVIVCNTRRSSSGMRPAPHHRPSIICASPR
jgi:hypothetical protein